MEEIRITNINELEFGDILVQRNGDKYVYADRCMYGEHDSYYNDADTVDCSYDSDFDYENSDQQEYDIVKVIRNGKIIFDKPVKEMTLKEICKELGYEVKIIKDKGEN